MKLIMRAGAAGLIAVACLSAAAPGAAAPNEARVPIEAMPVTLDPQRISQAHEFRIAQDLFEGLTTEGPDGALMPGVATSWSVSADGLTWTFRLRPDARWSDGALLTANDFVFAFQRAVDPSRPSPAADVFLPIKGAKAILDGKDGDPCDLAVRALDPHTFVVTLVHPTPWFPALMAHFAAMPVPKALVEANPEGWARSGVGDGAYRLVSWRDRELRLARNPNFHDASAVQVATVREILRPDPALALAAVKRGDLDVAPVTLADYLDARTKRPQTAIRQTEVSTTLIFANVKEGPSRWGGLRRALSLVLDRGALVKLSSSGDGAPAYEVVSPTLPGYQTARLTWADHPKAERVKEALTMIHDPVADIALTVPVQLTFSDTAVNRQIANAIVARWRSALGLSVELRPLPAKAFVEALQKHQFQFALAGWDPAYPDASDLLNVFRSEAGDDNFGQVSDPFFDELMDKADSTVDAAARARLMRQAEQRLLDLNAVIPLWHGVVDFVEGPRLSGWAANPYGRHPSRFLKLTSARVR
jgi:oligopeptide transport system substrate-binding protein